MAHVPPLPLAGVGVSDGGVGHRQSRMRRPRRATFTEVLQEVRAARLFLDVPLSRTRYFRDF